MTRARGFRGRTVAGSGETGGGPYLSSRMMTRPKVRVSAVRVRSVAWEVGGIETGPVEL